MQIQFFRFFLIFKWKYLFFSLFRICVDSIKRHHLFSNIASRKTLIGVREITDEMKIGAFRLRSKQLESMGLAVCEINYRRYKNVQMGKKYQYLHEKITKCGYKDVSTD